ADDDLRAAEHGDQQRRQPEQGVRRTPPVWQFRHGGPSLPGRGGGAEESVRGGAGQALCPGGFPPSPPGGGGGGGGEGEAPGALSPSPPTPHPQGERGERKKWRSATTSQRALAIAAALLYTAPRERGGVPPPAHKALHRGVD